MIQSRGVVFDSNTLLVLHASPPGLTMQIRLRVCQKGGVMVRPHPILLLVESDPDHRFLTIHALNNSALGVEVRSMASGELALQYLLGQGRFEDQEQHRRPSLVLLDLWLPGMSGFDLLRAMKETEQLRSIPAMVLTMSDEDRDRREALELGAVAYCQKPSDFSLLVPIVRELLQQHDSEVLVQSSTGRESRRSMADEEARPSRPANLRISKPGPPDDSASEISGHRFPTPHETRVYVVDDDEETTVLLGHFLRECGYEVTEFRDPLRAREAIEERSPHILLTDRNMPGIGGFDLARLALEDDPDIGVIIVTGARDVGMAVEAFRLGVRDYLLKPLDRDVVERSVQRVMIHRTQELYHRDREARIRSDLEARTRDLEAKNRLLEGVSVGAFSALVRMLEERTPQFTGHSGAVADLAERLALDLGLSEEEVWACRTAGFLHDIGMIAVPDQILEKPSPLGPEERERVKEHCRVGRELLAPFPHLGPVPDYVFLHHERVDGSGYPKGLTRHQIPLGAQIIALADSYRALVEARPFRPAHDPAEAVEILRGTAGIWHAPDLLNSLARIVPVSEA